jgi:hydroxyacylglutathione hydrolase
MRVEIVPCLFDNYAYLAVAPSGEAAVVDPSEAEPVLAAVRRAGVRLCAIWNTHHHADHTGGNEGLLALHPHLRVYGHVSDRGRIPGQTDFLSEGDEVELGAIRARVLHNPGHTLGAISYFGGGVVFTGDTLFSAGCGRLFEGDPAMMHASLEKIASLPPETLAYCGHEYTRQNLAFALSVEPSNDAARARAAEVELLRAAGRPTVPSTLALERATNPFLRSALPAVARAVGREDPVEVFAELRRRKDTFSS